MSDHGRIDRRRFGTLAAGAAALAAPPARAQSRPNFVFILSDDHRWDALGFLKPWLPTPNLDRLAREGAHFRNAFVTTSLCSPSRASLLTGQYASRHGVQNNRTPWRDQNLTYLELLHAAGYYTGFIGKWHMPGQGLPDLVGQNKLDHMVSFSIGTGQGIYNNCPLVVNGKPALGPGYITDVLTSHALDFMREAGDRPFCLYLSHKAVHDPFTPPERYAGSLKGAPFHPMNHAERRLPVGAVHANQLAHFNRNQQGYYETLRGVDDSVGAVLKFLDERGLAGNTVVVYAGDNGYFWGEHGLIDKRYAYEESMRIPLLLRWPGRCPAGLKVSDLTLNIDLAPTLLAAAGLNVPASMQGQSWLPLLRAYDPRVYEGGTGELGFGARPDRIIPAADFSRESFLYEYFSDPPFPHPPIRAIRTRDWKLVTYPGTRFMDELYHLAADPREEKNLIGSGEAAKVEKNLRAELARLIREVV